MMNERRTVAYVIPGGMSIESAIYNMIVLARQDDQVWVVAEHNGIEIAAIATSTPDEVLSQWDRARVEREMRNHRLSPVRTAIRYLLSTVSSDDRKLLLMELASYTSGEITVT